MSTDSSLKVAGAVEHSPASAAPINERARPAPEVVDSLDPFDLERLRLSQDFAAELGIKSVLTTVPVRRPANESWFRVHPDPEYQIETMFIELKERSELYLVSPALRSHLMGESTLVAKRLYTVVTRQGVVLLWGVRMPNAQGELDPWNKSAHTAALHSIQNNCWIRLVSNRDLGAYEMTTSSMDGAVTWPEQGMRELLRIAFRDRFIDNLDNPVLKQLRGEN